MNGRVWTKKEEGILSKIYTKSSCNYITSILDRSWISIKNRAKLLKLRRDESIKHPKIEPNVRFHKKYTIDNDTGCWNWLGKLTKEGYGVFRATTRKHLKCVQAHVFAYQAKYGAVPDGLELDHLCRNRKCVNPDHLEAVTNPVNVLRGISPPAINARKTHCIHGHSFSGENLYIQPSTGYRYCRQCKRNSERKCNA